MAPSEVSADRVAVTTEALLRGDFMYIGVGAVVLILIIIIIVLLLR